jgi:hypothetical protein
VGSNPSADIDLFIDANAFNWLIGGTDAHVKNYSLLIESALGKDRILDRTCVACGPRPTVISVANPES